MPDLGYIELRRRSPASPPNDRDKRQASGFRWRTATAAGDDIHVAIKEWRTPTPRSHPHDPLVTSDGAIWYTGQMANLLGRLDPKTGNSASIV